MGIQTVHFPMRHLLGSLIGSCRAPCSLIGGSRQFVNSTVCCSADGKKSGGVSGQKSKVDDSNSNEEIPEVVLKEVPDAKNHWEYQQSSEEAQVFDRKPVKVKCKEGKIYMWCACGHSHRQPFCDGTHRLPHLKFDMKPVPWTCQKTGFYWFCQCKKTNMKPFCDGTHLELPENTLTTIKY